MGAGFGNSKPTGGCREKKRQDKTRKENQGKERKGKEKKGKEGNRKDYAFWRVNSMKSPGLYWAAQWGSVDCLLDTAGQAAKLNCRISSKSA